MKQKITSFYTKISDKFTINKPWDIIILFVLNVLIAIPIFIITHQNLIQYNWYINLDRILIFIVILIIIQLVLYAMRRIILISIILYLIALIYGTFFGKI